MALKKKNLRWVALEKKEFKANGPVQIKINKNLGDDFDFTSCISTAKIPADQTST